MTNTEIIGHDSYPLPNGRISSEQSGQASQIKPVHSEDLIERLDLAGLPKALVASVKGSIWGEIDDGKMLLECRTVSVLQQPRDGGVAICDFDDCLMSATGWHKKEYQLLEQSEELHSMGVKISAERARAMYELSKIRVPLTVENEPRYTPTLNQILASLYVESLRTAAAKECPEEQSWLELLDWKAAIDGQIQKHGEKALKAYAIHPLISKIFMGNPPSKFLYRDFVLDVLAATRPNDIRIIATRGKIEGPLGQIHKIHGSGLMKERIWAGQRIDLVIYSNDIKAQALITLTEVLPGIKDRLIRIYDDNPNEVLPYLGVARQLGTSNIEVVQVSHPDAKRKGVNLDVEPNLDYMRRGTRLRHYSPFHDHQQSEPIASATSL
ncbi:MAG: hypothetical protein V1872_13710 [bacterium]